MIFKREMASIKTKTSDHASRGCMQTNFGEHGLFGFGDIATFQIRPNFPFGPWGSKNRIDSKNSCK